VLVEEITSFTGKGRAVALDDKSVVVLDDLPNEVGRHATRHDEMREWYVDLLWAKRRKNFYVT
jgi:hypothetical protein